MSEDQARERLLRHLEQARKLGDPCAVTGGEGLPPTLVFECVAETWPDRRVVHLDADEARASEAIRDAVRRSMEPGSVLLVTITRRAGHDLFRYLERLVQERALDVPSGEGWETVRAPEGWSLVIHSPSGPFPFGEQVPARIAL